MGGNELTLEKLRVKERLEAVEEHMKTGEENRQVLIKGFDELKTTVKGMEATLFGDKGEIGIIQKIDAFLKIADAIKTILTRIFVSICSAMVFAALPNVLKWISIALSKHIGG